MIKKVKDLTVVELIKLKKNCKPSIGNCNQCPLDKFGADCYIVINNLPEPPSVKGWLYEQEIEVEEDD